MGGCVCLFLIILSSLSECCGCGQKGQTAVWTGIQKPPSLAMFPLKAEQPRLVCWVQAEKQAPSTCVYTTALQTWAVFLFKSFWCHISLLPQKCWSISLMKSFWIYVRFPVYVFLCKGFHVISRVYEILGGITWSANIVLVRQLFVGFGSSQENRT